MHRGARWRGYWRVLSAPKRRIAFKTPQDAFTSAGGLRRKSSRLLSCRRTHGASGAQLVDVIIILVLIGALTALLVFKSLMLALAIVVGALILTFVIRAKPEAGKGLRPSWSAKCPKCRNVMNSKEVACDNCGAHAVRMGGKTAKKLKCGRCDMPVANPKCPKCETVITPKFWQ